MDNDSKCPRIVLTGVSYLGQPVYKQWNDQKSACYFFSREIKLLARGGWKFVRWVPLHEVKVDFRYGLRARERKVELAMLHVLTLPGIKS